MIASQEPFLSFFTDLLETPDVGDNLIIVCQRWYPVAKPQPRVIPSKPPARRGVPGKPVPNTSGKRDWRRK